MTDVALTASENPFASRFINALPFRLAGVDWQGLHDRLDMLECSFGPHDAVLVDGAGHIGPLAWRRISRCLHGAGRLIITTHRPGRLPVLYRCETSLASLDALMAELAPAMANTKAVNTRLSSAPPPDTIATRLS